MAKEMKAIAPVGVRQKIIARIRKEVEAVRSVAEKEIDKISLGTGTAAGHGKINQYTKISAYAKGTHTKSAPP